MQNNFNRFFDLLLYFAKKNRALCGLLLPVCLGAQSPHGEGFAINCAACHSPEGWAIAGSAWERGVLVKPTDGDTFDHANTGFPLSGRHAYLDCRDCHETLAFAEAQTDCIACHTDLHQMTVGDDCARCHSTENWLVDQVTEIHQDNGFPLLGNHAMTSCFDCHVSETALRFDRIGNDCVNCHLPDYMVATKPDHQAAGFSLTCQDCHDVAGNGWQWSAGGFGHSFFPLTDGHEINDCSACHAGGVFQNTPTDCFACHEADFRATTGPDHEAANFPTDCTVCHTTAVGWPASAFSQHDELYFPIYSGKHNGEWSDCLECHTTSGDFSKFSCIDCHEHNDASDMADEHEDVQGYVFSSQACYGCHPKGEE